MKITGFSPRGVAGDGGGGGGGGSVLVLVLVRHVGVTGAMEVDAAMGRVWAGLGVPGCVLASMDCLGRASEGGVGDRGAADVMAFWEGVAEAEATATGDATSAEGGVVGV